MYLTHELTISKWKHTGTHCCIGNKRESIFFCQFLTELPGRRGKSETLEENCLNSGRLEPNSVPHREPKVELENQWWLVSLGLQFPWHPTIQQPPQTKLDMAYPYVRPFTTRPNKSHSSDFQMRSGDLLACFSPNCHLNFIVSCPWCYFV